MFRSTTTGTFSALKQSNFLPFRNYSQLRERLPRSQSPIVSRPAFFNSVTFDGQQIPTYRVLDGVGKLLDATFTIEIDEQLARRLYENMQLLPALDNILYNVQRQGKISFYMTTYGEEATITGAAAGLAMNDEVLGQYREMGVLLWRKFGIQQVFAQCFGNQEDMSGKGRQMPVHFGSPEHHFHTISSPLATQIPQAAGVAYALRRMRSGAVAACFFGEGAASEGDFHAGLMLASTIPSPVIFIVRNNGFAISTPSTEQYNGDGIASRGPGYGIDTIRVDGNDVLAVMTAVKEARRRCVEEGRPALVEAMTYRVGHHSTSDDSFAYRPRSEVEDRKRIDNPIVRFRLYMESQGWWNAEAEESLKARLKAEVMKEFKRAESMSLCEVGELFTDVYGGEVPWNIREQREELGSLLKKYSKSWEPWRNQLAKYKNEGQDIMEE
ncbi:branched-chain alpha-keto acid dehydrogenase E1-alpha subunit [Guyanagaster necrorhizus]|uniref:2-oxoisovalerate dehydrogenase subunit alpha n=1 Tax=Guyanagaster necrorhizus TaxID=856835 RepID=A0A9P7VLY8_9AGAR|nr:branched-chain alpha-keto acid dehydrogenase E1-alpha subunit [Guyanagaster necrorhizus MCA 3950]KAG7443124.1 branched-chain alpha-keto acid dehydrogenase E1-alpha subunit [Guyanagaster necrorhizus MCA 3950]